MTSPQGESKYKSRVKYLAIPRTKTSNKLFIIQLLYFMRISYMAEKANQITERRKRSRPVKQVFFIAQNNNLSKFAWFSRYLYSTYYSG